ncbi:MAG TPA: hypothetical protein VEG36_12465 [Burkholderiales bacterium]|nr:hypothetical protein [Burkholderiales bacterium]
MKATIAMMGAVSAALVSFAAAAQQDEPRFEEVKQRVEQRIQERIADLQSRLTCVQNAQDPDAMRGCFPQRAGSGAGRGSGHRGGLKPQ